MNRLIVVGGWNLWKIDVFGCFLNLKMRRVILVGWFFWWRKSIS